MLYHVKPEFLDLWGSEVLADTIITDKEVARLADEWEKSVEELLEELEELHGMVVNAEGKFIPFNAAIGMMDEELVEALNEEMAPCTEQEFFTAYEKAHADKYGEEWELSKANPVW